MPLYPGRLLVFAMYSPTMLPTPATPTNCASTSTGNPTAARDARMPELTPKIPRAFPCLAVAWEARPEMEPVIVS